MSTTAIRLSDELKQRVSRVAESMGTTSHGFILEAIREKTGQLEQQARLHEVADQRHAGMIATGGAVAWSDMRRYMEDRLAGKAPAHPAARKLAP